MQARSRRTPGAGQPIAAVMLVVISQWGWPGAATAAQSSGADTACRQFTQQQVAQIGAALQAALRSEQKSFSMPSAGVALFGCEGMLWVGAVGFADKDQHVPAGADTVFRAPAKLPSGSIRRADPKLPVSYAEMQSYDAPRIPAPATDEGLPPVVGSHTTLSDMASLGGALLSSSRASGGPKSGKATAGAASPQSFEGAAAGFVSKFSLLPAAGIGAVAYSALDHSSSATRLTDYALKVALAARDGKQLPANPTSRALSADEALPLVGEYLHDKATVRVRWMSGSAFIETPRLAGRLRRGLAGYVMDDYTTSMALNIDSGGRWLVADGVRYARVASEKPAPPPSEIVGLIGDYGRDYDAIRALERDGTLFLRIDGVMYERMAPVTADIWQFPRVSPSHPGERVQFTRDKEGRGTQFTLNGSVFPCRNIIIDPPAGKLSEQDRALLRQRALAGSPPKEPEPQKAGDLVSVSSVDPSIKLDVRYATSRNLLGFPVYSRSAAYLQRPAAEALARADQKLHAQGFAIVVFDAYRPWFVTKMFWDGTPEAAHVFVANPGDGSRHNRGAAVDISLIELATGQEVTMTGAYDEFSPRSYPLYDGGTSEQRWGRDVLRAALQSEHFTVYPYEWWHFDYADWKSYGLQNVEFAQLPP